MPHEINPFEPWRPRPDDTAREPAGRPDWLQRPSDPTPRPPAPEALTRALIVTTLAQSAGSGSNGPSAFSSGCPGGVGARIVSRVVARVSAT